VATILVPFAGFLANAVLRAGRGVAQSAASDLLLLLIMFDAGVIIASDQFKPLVPNPMLREAIVSVHVALLFVGLVAWITAVAVIERRIAYAFDPRRQRYASGFPLMAWLGAWGVAAVVLSCHLSIFTGGPLTWAP
jgi:cytochrome c biogenesis factor